MSTPAPRVLLAPISVGELLDKITILDIKAERLSAGEARANVERELGALKALRDAQDLPTDIEALADALAQVNRRLWDVEDALRRLEGEGRFDADFIALARSVYGENDRRAALKRQINALANSMIVEEKLYSGPA